MSYLITTSRSFHWGPNSASKDFWYWYRMCFRKIKWIPAKMWLFLTTEAVSKNLQSEARAGRLSLETVSWLHVIITLRTSFRVHLVCVNGWVFVYQLSGSGFESLSRHLKSILLLTHHCPLQTSYFGEFWLLWGFLQGFNLKLEQPSCKRELNFVLLDNYLTDLFTEA